MSSIVQKMLLASAQLADASDAVSLPAQAAFVYNPLRYAWAPYELYVSRYAQSPKKCLFLGMNPGPFGMAQTGVPFGEIDAVVNWMHIETPVGKPAVMHPKRPIDGFACHRSEASGRRLWGLFRELYGTAERFFASNYVTNYCPLIWMTESGANITPDKLPSNIRQQIDAACMQFLKTVIQILEPKILVGIGAYAARKMQEAANLMPERHMTVGSLLHPSPASPVANKFWPERPIEQLKQLGVWPDN